MEFMGLLNHFGSRPVGQHTLAFYTKCVTPVGHAGLVWDGTLLKNQVGPPFPSILSVSPP